MEHCRKSIVFTVNRFNNGDRVGVGGFADRIKGLFFIYYVSILVDRDFYINWDYPDDLAESFDLYGREWVSKGYDHKMVDWVDRNFTEDVKSDLESGATNFKSIYCEEAVVFVSCNNFVLDVIKGNDEKFVSLGLPVKSESEIFKYCFDNLLGYKPPKQLFNNYLNEFESFKKELDGVIGVQFRVGGSDSGWRDPMLDSVDNIPILMDVIMSLSSDQGMKKFGLLVTTDNEKAKSEILNAANDLKVPIFYFNEKAEHLDRSSKELASKMSSQVYFEHYMLSTCDLIVVGNGRFGVTAAHRKGINPINYHRYGGATIPSKSMTSDK